MEDDCMTVLAFVSIQFYDVHDKELGIEHVFEFDYFGSNCRKIRVPFGSTSVYFTFGIDAHNCEIPIFDGSAVIEFLNASGKKIGYEVLESNECSDEEGDFDVPVESKFVRIRCDMYC